MTLKTRKTSLITLTFILLFLISIEVHYLFVRNTALESTTNVTSTFESLKSLAELTKEDAKSIYLSDIEYITTNNWSYNGWSGHQIAYDKNQDGGKLSLRVDGNLTYFTKGVSVHAKGQVTYDISSLSTRFPRFIAYIGVDGARGSNGDLWIQILASKDGKSWESLLKTVRMNGMTPAVDVDLNIEGYNYLRIYADPNGSNAADHATIANARLVTADFDKNAAYYNKIHPVEYYDNILKNYSVEENYNNNYRLVLEREVVNKLGYANLQDAAEFVEGMEATLDWLFASNERLEQIIEVGEISSPTKVIQIINDIYKKYSSELDSNFVYTKMAIALAATYATDAIHSPLRFGQYAPTYDYVERFTLMKQLFDENLFMRVVNNGKAGQLVQHDWFKDYHIELIRMIMNEGIGNDELLWMNGYTHYRSSFSEGMVPYLTPIYTQAKLYNEANRDLYNNKYLLNQYGVPFGDKTQRYWMVIEAGGICWNQSRLGQTMFRVNGLPAVGAYQPGHEMYFTYYQDNNGNGYWSERYGNYNGAGTTWGGGGRYRLIFNWGAKSFTDQNIGGSKGGTSLGYLYLAQANLNNYAKYKKSLYYNLIANSYEDKNKKIETYFDALDVNATNLDSFDSLLKLYKAMSDKNEGGTITSLDWYNLALRVTESYEHYPVAMFDLLKVIRPYLEGEKKLDIDMIEKRYLTAATTISAETANSIGAVNAAGGIRTHAKRLLGLAQPDPISFSFDGENGGKIVKNENYQFHWAYSLDGGNTFSQYTEEEFVALTKEEIETITSENDIVIRFMGLNDYRFTVDIIEGTIPDDLFGSDLENKVVGTTTSLEWRFHDNEEWVSLSTEEPDLAGNKTVEVRIGYTGRSLPSVSKTFTFTEDNQPDTRKYVSISHLTLENVSSEATSNTQKGDAINALDANYNTRWHSNWNGSDSQRYFTIKLDEARYISSVEFVPAGGGNGKIIDGIIYGSMDGEEWVELTRRTGLTYSNSADSLSGAIANIKDFAISDPQKVKYIRIQATKASNGNWFTARAFNLYEDKTIIQAAEFSFDGKNAGKITLMEEFEDRAWEYSIDGGKTFTKGTSNSHQLSSNEIDEINSENGIKIRIDGDNTIYTISIKKALIPTINPYLNDLENRLIAISNIETLEWKIDNGPWTFYQDQEPIVTGTKTLYVRTKATRITAASDAIEYQFTEDNQPNTMKYVPIKHLSIHGYSTQSVDASRPFYAPNAIDANPNTLWHSDFRYDVRQQDGYPFLTIKLDEARYISAFEFIQKKYREIDPDYIKTGIVYVSEDGVNWTEAGRIENIPQKHELRRIEFNESVYGQYVRFEMETYDIFASVAMINLYEDITKRENITPTAEVKYSTTNLTNQDVTATLINPSTEITITNNGGNDSITFTENGSFVFEFEDAAGNKGSVEAVVDWIDKKEIGSAIAYNINSSTNQDVVATIAFNKDNVTVKGGNTHIFTENGEYTFEFEDAAGNRGTATAKVDWIDREAPVGSISYSTLSPTNQDVTAEITFNEENVVVTGGNTHVFTENGEYTFEFVGPSGNRGTATAKVDWIDRTLPKATITYDINHLTNKDVVATVTFDKENVVVTGGNTHTFTENGEYEFEFVGPAGNQGTIIAKVDWIDKKAPKATVIYSSVTTTNQDVMATVTFDKENVTVKGGNTHVFTENGEYVFEYEDAAGNKGIAIAMVSWIEKIAPKAEIEYSTINPTNEDVIVTIKFDKAISMLTENVRLEDLGNNTYRMSFSNNTTLVLEFIDSLGNKGTETIKIDWIDKDAPCGKVNYSIENLTNEDVVATLETSEEVRVINNDRSREYTFTENGEFTFEYEDAAGNKGSTTAKVDWIDKEAPVGTITYSTEELTNEDVVATITFDKENVVVKDGNTHIFTENGEFTFEFEDAAGNKGTLIAKVDWIDKEAPVGTILYSTKDLTDQDVIVTLETNEPVTILNNEGLNTFTFTENGDFTFEFVDRAGNKGFAVAKVTWILKNTESFTVTVSPSYVTNQDVTVTLELNEGVVITNNEGLNTYTFTENGKFTFEYIDIFGNAKTYTIIVNWIDKEAPVGTIVYSTTSSTNQEVIATLIGNEKIKVLNNNGEDFYTFTENGEFTFEFEDEAGNKSTATAKVDWIDKDAPVGTILYSTKDLTSEDVIVTLETNEPVTILNNEGSNTYIFTENGEFTFEFVDRAGNKGVAVAKVTWISKNEYPFTVVFDNKEITDQDVTVTLELNEGITILNNGGSNTYIFTENGEFTFEYIDQNGVVGTYVVKVDWIQKNENPSVPEEPIVPDVPNIPVEPVLPDVPDIPVEPVLPDIPNISDESVEDNPVKPSFPNNENVDNNVDENNKPGNSSEDQEQDVNLPDKKVDDEKVEHKIELDEHERFVNNILMAIIAGLTGLIIYRFIKLVHDRK